jgi:hypothetical protein
LRRNSNGLSAGEHYSSYAQTVISMGHVSTSEKRFQQRFLATARIFLFERMAQKSGVDEVPGAVAQG